MASDLISWRYVGPDDVEKTFKVKKDTVVVDDIDFFVTINGKEIKKPDREFILDRVEKSGKMHGYYYHDQDGIPTRIDFTRNCRHVRPVR